MSIWRSIQLVSFRFDLFRFVLFRFVSICFVSFRSVSFRFDLFRFVSICFVSFLFRFALYRDPTQITLHYNFQIFFKHPFLLVLLFKCTYVRCSTSSQKPLNGFWRDLTANTHRPLPSLCFFLATPSTEVSDGTQVHGIRPSGLLLFKSKGYFK